MRLAGLSGWFVWLLCLAGLSGWFHNTSLSRNGCRTRSINVIRRLLFTHWRKTALKPFHNQRLSVNGERSIWKFIPLHFCQNLLYQKQHWDCLGKKSVHLFHALKMSMATWSLFVYKEGHPRWFQLELELFITTSIRRKVRKMNISCKLHLSLRLFWNETPSDCSCFWKRSALAFSFRAHQSFSVIRFVNLIFLSHPSNHEGR